MNGFHRGIAWGLFIVAPFWGWTWLVWAVASKVN